MSIFWPSRHENWWMTFPQKNVQQNWKSKSCDFGRLPNSLFHAYLKIWKRNASPLAKKNTKKRLSKMSKAHISHDSSVKRIFRICWDFTPKKMGEKNLVLVMDIPWNRGCQPSKAKSQIDSYSKICQNSQNLSKKKSSATTVCCFNFDDFDGVELLLDKSEHVRINKSQGANIHVFHPLHLGTSALGNKLSWDQRQISWGVTEPARFFSYYATCRCSWPGSGVF